MIALFVALLTLSVPVVFAQDACNPLVTASCAPIPGLPTSTYSVDFTQQTALPDGWILANYANVTFGAEGAKFWFNSRGQAPYIWTNFYIAYGRVDVELMVSNGTGIITSSVLFSDDQDEIDWEFSGSNFASTSGKAFTNYFGKGLTGSYDRASLQDVTTPQKTFHTYSFNWTPQALTWIIDGAQKFSTTNSGLNTGNYQFPQTPARLHLGLWDAGDPNTAAGTVNWSGGYTNYSNTPYYAIVRSVKISTPYPCSSWQYPTNFSGKWADVQCKNQTISTSSTSSTQTITSSASATSVNTKCTASSYTVTGGDYGWSIADEFGLSFSALSVANTGVNWDQLSVGQILNVPCNVVSTSGSSSSTVTTASSSTGISSSVSSVNRISSSSISSMSSGSSSSSTIFSASTNSSSSRSTQSEATSSSLSLSPNPTTLTTSTTISSSSSSSTSDAALYAKCTSGSYTYYVVAGDVGSRISDKLGVRFDYVSQANSGIDWNYLKAGQALQVPCEYSTITSATSVPTSTTVSSSGSSTTASFTSMSSSIISSSLIVGIPLLNTPTSSSASSSQSGSVQSGVSTNLPQGWQYKSCFTDSLNPRSLNISSDLSASQMTNTRCISYCSAKGYVYAGTEWSGECYCGMQLSNSRVANETDCNMKCYAASAEMCGGDARLSVYYNTTANLTEVGSLASSASAISSVVPANSVNGGSSSTSLGVTITTTSLSSRTILHLATSSTVATTASTITSFVSTTAVSASSTCTSDQCLSYMTAMSTAASNFCATFMNPARTITSDIYANVFAQGCSSVAVKLSSACSCLTASASSLSTTPSVQTTPSRSALPTVSSIHVRRQHVRGGLSWNKWRSRGEKQYDGHEAGDTTLDSDRGPVRAGRRVKYGG